MYVEEPKLKPVEKPKRETISERQLVDRLRRYAAERLIALDQYPGGYYYNEKIKALDELVYMLDEAEKLQPKDCIKAALKTERLFHYVSPTKRTDFNTWFDKINSCMAACREYLGWRSQTTAF